jgi:hypothetical protein
MDASAIAAWIGLPIALGVFVAHGIVSEDLVIGFSVSG